MKSVSSFSSIYSSLMAFEHEGIQLVPYHLLQYGTSAYTVSPRGPPPLVSPRGPPPLYSQSHPEDRLLQSHPEDRLLQSHPDDRLLQSHTEDRLLQSHPEDRLVQSPLTTNQGYLGPILAEFPRNNLLGRIVFE